MNSGVQREANSSALLAAHTRTRVGPRHGRAENVFRPELLLAVGCRRILHCRLSRVEVRVGVFPRLKPDVVRGLNHHKYLW